MAHTKPNSDFLPKAMDMVSVDRPSQANESLEDGKQNQLQMADGQPDQLQALEEIISRGLHTFFEVGGALLIIRREELYRLSGYTTFAEYCQKRWDITPRRMRQITDGTEVLNTLREYDDRNHGSLFGGRLPENERQVRPLMRLRGNVEELGAAWSTVLAQAPEGRVTGAIVKDAVATTEQKGTKPPKRYTILADLERGRKLLREAKKELGQHFEYFADQISQLPMDLLDKRIKLAARAPKDGKAVFGTWEWVDAELDCISGCSNDCRYCYAKAKAIRTARYSGKTAANWAEESELEKWRVKEGRKPAHSFMFPTQHDITPTNMGACLGVIDTMLGREGVDRLLIVSKPHRECIQAICSQFREHKEQIEFRFTIGSANDAVLSFWEPNAPQFEERLECLKHAHEQGFATSVSCEPMLDGEIQAVLGEVERFVSDFVWLGKANLLCQRVGANCPGDEEALNRARGLMAQQNSQFIWELYHRLKDHPKVKWKESIKKVVGLPRAVEAGTDE